jgi:hypothetical protein
VAMKAPITITVAMPVMARQQSRRRPIS